MADKTYKNILDDGYTTYHDDGTKSTTYKNILDDGYTTYHSDGSKSTSYKNILDDGVTTYHPDGSKSTSYKNILDDGVTTYHPDGSKSVSYKNFLDDGITTYHSGGYGASSGGYGSSLYSDPYSMPYSSIPYVGGSVHIDTTPYRMNRDTCPLWILGLVWLAFGLVFQLPFRTAGGIQTEQACFTLSSCLIAIWASMQIQEHIGFVECFTGFCLSFTLLYLNKTNGSWLFLLFVAPTAFVIFLYEYSTRLQINYVGKLHGVFIFVALLLIGNAVMFLVRFQLGLEILTLVWLAATVIMLIVNMVRWIIDLVKKKPWKSFSKMRYPIAFGAGLLIPVLVRVVFGSAPAFTVGILTLVLYLIPGILLAKRDSLNRRLIGSLLFGFTFLALCFLIASRFSYQETVPAIFYDLDQLLRVDLLDDSARFGIDLLSKAGLWFSDVIAGVAEVIYRLLEKGFSLAHRSVPDLLALPNNILYAAYGFVPVVLVSMLGVAIGRKISVVKNKKK